MVVVDTSCAHVAGKLFEATANDTAVKSGQSLRALAQELLALPTEVDTDGQNEILTVKGILLIEG